MAFITRAPHPPLSRSGEREKIQKISPTYGESRRRIFSSLAPCGRGRGEGTRHSEYRSQNAYNTLRVN